MPRTKTPANTGSLMLNIFDGARQPFGSASQILVRIWDGYQKELVSKFCKPPSILFKKLPFYDNFGDNYTVVASADGYVDAGFTPVKIFPNTVQSVDLMLLGKNATFNFRDALWPTLKRNHPKLATLLAHGDADDAAAEARYSQLMEERPASLASFFNLAAAMSAINLPIGTPLDYIKEVIWDDTFGPDRFFGYADPKLIEQVKLAAQQGAFVPEPGSWLFHEGATSSWKQVQFGEANVQLTFHEGDIKTIDGLRCMKVEPDIDYYKDPGAHFLLEVVVHAISHTMTDPKQAYVLRWIAGRHAGVPEFDPPYTLV
jgi:hypothetical protein